MKKDDSSFDGFSVVLELPLFDGLSVVSELPLFDGLSAVLELPLFDGFFVVPDVSEVLGILESLVDSSSHPEKARSNAQSAHSSRIVVSLKMLFFIIILQKIELFTKILVYINYIIKFFLVKYCFSICLL